MRKLPAIALTAVSAALLAGTAIAAERNSHIMNVALPDGSTARVEYVGNVAPKVTIEPATNARADTADADDDWAVPNFAAFDRMMAQMNRESEVMMRQAQALSRQPADVGAAPSYASFGNAPAGMSSTTVVSYSNGSSTCTRTTETVSQGADKAPKVTSTVSGNCASSRAPAQPEASSGPISRT